MRSRYPARLVLSLSVLAVVAGLATVARPAEAQAGPTFTVGLQPGWNLVGWVEPEASVQHLFDTIPRAEAVFAWDAKEQRFRGAYADPSLNTQRDLEEIKPGMGLWVWLDGTDPFAWKRPISRDPAVDSLSLQEGWNLVAWTGLDGVAAATGLERLVDDGARVMMWDATGSRLVEYDATVSAPDGAPLLRRGGALWVSASAELDWGHEVVIEPTVVFHGDVPEARQAHVRATVDHVVVHYAERFGTYLSNTTFHFTANDSLFQDMTEEVKGAASSLDCLDYGAEAAFFNLSCDQLDVDWVYFFALRSHLTVPVARELGWTKRGWDLYERALYRGSLEDAFPASYESYEAAHEEARRRVGEWEPAPKRPLHPAGQWSPSLGFLGVDWLVRRAGTYSVYEFLLAIPWAESSADAFGDVFGLTPDEFYDEFELYVGTIVPPRWELSGSFFDKNGDALGKWLLRTVAQPVADYGERSSSQRLQGYRLFRGFTPPGFSMKVEAGAYILSVAARCDAQTILLGWYDGAGGLTTNRAEAASVVVEGGEVSIDIKLPRLPSEVSPLCKLESRVAIEGVVTGPDGQPVPDIYLQASLTDFSPATSREYERYPIDIAITDDDGTFKLHVLDDRTYRIDVRSGRCEEEPISILGSYDSVAGFTRQLAPGESTHIAIEGEDVTGIHVRLPAWEYGIHLQERQKCRPSGSDSGE